MAIMLAWAVTALACGYLVLSRTDVTSIGRPRRRRPRVPLRDLATTLRRNQQVKF
jgi:hypothetical protein